MDKFQGVSRPRPKHTTSHRLFVSKYDFPNRHRKATERGKANFDYTPGHELALAFLKGKGIEAVYAGSRAGQWAFNRIK